MADIVISGNTSGSVTLRAPDIAGSPILTLPTTSGTIVTTAGAASLTTSGNLTFTGTGNRITGDFSNATVANRVGFQSSTGTFTSVSVLGPGASQSASIDLILGNDATNTSRFHLLSSTVDARLSAGIYGTGTYVPMTFFTGGSERLRIDTSGNVLIGTTSASPVSGITAAGQVVMAGSRAFLGTLAGGDTALGGTSGSNFTSLYVNGSENVRLNISGSLVLKGGFADATGTGITFPATQSASSNANTLDDYEEGTFTPTYYGATTTGTTTYTGQQGTYTKIGNQVYVEINISWTGQTATGSGSAGTIGGLPFTSAPVSPVDARALFYMGAYNSYSINGVLTGVVNPSNTRIELYSITTTGGIADSLVSNVGNIRFQFFYRVA